MDPTSETPTTSASATKKDPIDLPVENFMSVFSFLSHIQLSSVSLACSHFNDIVQPRLEQENARLVPEMRFVQDKMNPKAAQLKKVVKYDRSLFGNHRYAPIPIATVPPLPNILGFERIAISFVDSSVVDFFRAIRPRLGTQQWSIFLWKTPKNNDVCQQLFSIMAGSIDTVDITVNDAPFDLFAEFFHSVQCLSFAHSYLEKWQNITVGAIVRWLHDRMFDGRPRLFFAHCDRNTIQQVVDECKKLFLEADSPVSFIFNFAFPSSDNRPAPFSVENKRTGEQLILGLGIDDEEMERATDEEERMLVSLHSQFLLRRFPIADQQSWRQLNKKQGKFINTCGTPNVIEFLAP